MKKNFAILFVAAMLSMVFISCGKDDPDEPAGKTSTPEVTFTVDDNNVVITAKGEGEVKLFANDVQVENPYTVERTAKEYTIHFTATAQKTSMTISETAYLDVLIPRKSTYRIESVHGETNDTYLVYDIDLDKDSSSIYVYNAVFTIGETSSPAMNIRVDAPVSVDETGMVFTFSGTDITPYLLRGNTPVPMPTMPVTNLISTVNTSEKTYYISFDCHGGHYDKTGKIL